MKELNGLPLHTSASGSKVGKVVVNKVGCLIIDGGRVIVFMFSAGAMAVLFSSSSGKDGKVSPRAVGVQQLYFSKQSFIPFKTLDYNKHIC